MPTVMEDEQGKQPPARWERAGLVVGVIIALAIMWGVLGFALFAGDGGGSNSPQVIYDQSSQKPPEEDD
jgi:hypothetical protein